MFSIHSPVFKKSCAQIFILTEDELFFRLHLFSTDSLIRIQAAQTDKHQRSLCSSRLLSCLPNLKKKQTKKNPGKIFPSSLHLFVLIHHSVKHNILKATDLWISFTYVNSRNLKFILTTLSSCIGGLWSWM